MATYYVDPVNGNNANNGTAAATPVKNLEWAMRSAAASEEIHISGTSKTSPVPFAINHNVATAMSLIGDGDDTQYISGGINITEGTSRGNMLESAGFDPTANTNIDPGCDLYVAGGTSPLGWDLINANPVVKESTIKVTGNSAKMAGAFTGIDGKMTLPAACSFRVDLKAYNSSVVTTNAVVLNVRDSATGLFWDFPNSGPFETNTGAQQLAFGATDDVWQDMSSFGNNIFTTVGYNQYQLRISNSSGNAAAVSYVDDVVLTNTSYPTYAWTNNGDGTYSLPCLHFTPRRVFVTTLADWVANGITGFTGDNDSLAYYTSLANCQENANSFYFNATTSMLYVNLGGRSPSDLHIEASPLYQFEAITVAKTLRNLTFGIYGSAVLTTTAALTMEDIHLQNARGGIGFGGGTSTWSRGSCSYIRPEPGTASNTTIDVTNGGTLTAYGVVSHHNADDGFQADGVSSTTTATMNLYGCVSHNNSDHGFSFKCRTDVATFNAKGILRNCTSYANADNGLDDSSDVSYTGHVTANTLTISNFVSYGNGFRDLSIARTGATGWSIATSFAGTTETQGADVVTGVTALTSAPFDTDTLVPTSTSPLVDAGTKWWTLEQRPIGGDGYPFPDFDIDAGGIQSKHSPHDPGNL